jgi:hypothetical protein
MWGAAMAWRQGQSYSDDLRGRVLAAVDGGMAARAAAKLEASKNLALLDGS